VPDDAPPACQRASASSRARRTASAARMDATTRASRPRARRLRTDRRPRDNPGRRAPARSPLPLLAVSSARSPLPRRQPREPRIAPEGSESPRLTGGNEDTVKKVFPSSVYRRDVRYITGDYIDAVSFFPLDTDCRDFGDESWIMRGYVAFFNYWVYIYFERSHHSLLTIYNLIRVINLYLIFISRCICL